MVKILVIQTSRFGDLLQTTPMIHALRRIYPDSYITLLSRYNVREICQDNPDMDHVELFNIEEYTNRLMNNQQDLYGFYIELRDAVNRLKSMHFDLLINATHDRFSTFLSYLIGAPEIRGMYLSAKNRLQIRISGLWFRYLRCSSGFRQIAPFNLADIYKNAVGGDQETLELFFNTPPGSLSEAEDLLGADPVNEFSYIGLQLGTSTGHRRWPAGYFADLGNMLQDDESVRVVLLGTKGEKDLGQEVTDRMSKDPINLIGKTNISQLAGVLKKTSLLVTNDTGTMHLAEAVGTRCVSLFFESANPFQTGPYGSGHIICSPEIECFPCPTTFECPEKKCLDLIPSKTIFELINYKLGKIDSCLISIPEGMRIHETCFNPLGVWDARPLSKISLSRNDLARRIYRNMWLRYSGEIGEMLQVNNNGNLEKAIADEFRLWSQHYIIDESRLKDWTREFNTDLDPMERLIDRGLGLIGEIIIASSQTPSDMYLVTGKSKELEKIDSEISNLGKSRPLLSQLSAIFEVELGQIEDGNFFTMLNQWKHAYDGLKRRVVLLRKEIKSALKEQERHE